MTRCPVCNEYYYGAQHKCAPEWEYRNPQDGDEWYSVRAHGAEMAATKAAESYDAEDYPLIRNESHSVVLELRDAPNGTIRLFRVRGESVPQYYATEVET